MAASFRLIAATCGALALAVPAAAQSGGSLTLGTPLMASLDTGEGEGTFTGAISADRTQMCYVLNVGGLPPVTASHIHTGGPGENGGPVVPLETPAQGMSAACTDVEPAVAEAMIANPNGYYVNVHTAENPAGAVRGQLMSH